MRLEQEKCKFLQDGLDEVKVESLSQSRQHVHELREAESKRATLESALSNLHAEIENHVTVSRTTNDKLARSETQIGDLESEVYRLKSRQDDTEAVDLVKRELTEQVAHIRQLEKNNRALTGELRRLREERKAVGIVEEEKRALEIKVRSIDDLQRELGEAKLRCQLLDNERSSWASYLEGQIEHCSPEEIVRALTRERMEKASLTERLGGIQPGLTEKDAMITHLEAQLKKSRDEVGKLQSSGAGRDDRAKSRLERQKALAVKEVDYLREQLRIFENEEASVTKEDGESKLQEFGALTQQYRTELDALHNELSRYETNVVPTDSTTLKRPREEEPDERVGELSRKNRKLQDDLAQLQQSTAILKTDLEATQAQLSLLQASSRHRILELRSNPTNDAETLKMTTVKTLRSENKSLLAQLEGNPLNTKTVPFTTLEATRLEIQELEKVVAEKEKRMLRLKQIWSLKSLEFREAVASLLGWQMDFMPNGRFRMTSIFNSDGPQDQSDDNGSDSGSKEHSLVFDGETGTMKISGGPRSQFATELKPLIRFWVEERQEIPAFLAATQLELYEKSTKAAKI